MAKGFLSKIRTDTPITNAVMHRGIFWAHMSVYLISGIAQPLLMSVLKLGGFSDWRSFLFQITNYTSELLLWAIPVPESFKNARPPPLWQRIVLGLIDCTSLAACMVGNVLAGSAIYAIIYSTVSVWTALEAWIFLRSRLNWVQWTGIVVGVFASLCCVKAAHADSLEALWGAIVVLLGSIGHGITYVAGSLLPSKGSMAPTRVSANYGLVGTSELLVIFLAVCVPNFNSIVVQPVQAAGWSVGAIVGVFIALFFADAVHAFSFFSALSSAGPVLMAVLKVVTAGMVALVAGITPLCNAAHPEECLTVGKLVSLGLAIVSLCIYVGGGEWEKRRKSALEGADKGLLMAESETPAEVEIEEKEENIIDEEEQKLYV